MLNYTSFNASEVSDVRADGERKLFSLAIG